MSHPWMKFYPTDWRADPALRMCSIGARGLWMEMLCVMHEAAPRGSLLVNGLPVSRKQLAGLAGITEREATTFLLELGASGVFSREDNGVIFSRRMRRDDEKAAKDRANGGLGGAPDLIGASVPKAGRVSRMSRKDNPTKVEAVWAACGGSCSGCGTQMQRERANDPTAFTIDHKVPIAEGGDNDLANLVGLCRTCNRRKGITPAASFSAHGDKAQIPEARSQKIDGDDDASASGRGTSLISEDAHRIADQVQTTFGLDPTNPPPAWYGAAYRVQQWLTAGWKPEIILAECCALAAKKRDGPPNSIAYCERPIAAAHARHEAPLPQVVHLQAQTVEVRPNAVPRTSNFADGLAALRTAEERLRASAVSECGPDAPRQLPARSG
jgi:hypothetical protein